MHPWWTVVYYVIRYKKIMRFWGKMPHKVTKISTYLSQCEIIQLILVSYSSFSPALYAPAQAHALAKQKLNSSGLKRPHSQISIPQHPFNQRHTPPNSPPATPKKPLPELKRCPSTQPSQSMSAQSASVPITVPSPARSHLTPLPWLCPWGLPHPVGPYWLQNSCWGSRCLLHLPSAPTANQRQPLCPHPTISSNRSRSSHLCSLNQSAPPSRYGLQTHAHSWCSYRPQDKPQRPHLSSPPHRWRLLKGRLLHLQCCPWCPPAAFSHRCSLFWVQHKQPRRRKSRRIERKSRRREMHHNRFLKIWNVQHPKTKSPSLSP